MLKLNNQSLMFLINNIYFFIAHRHTLQSISIYSYKIIGIVVHVEHNYIDKGIVLDVILLCYVDIVVKEMFEVVVSAAIRLLQLEQSITVRWVNTFDWDVQTPANNCLHKLHFFW